jgi:hypothetical protein
VVNVLNFVDRVDKDIPGFRHQYDLLSEIAHPNWAGTVFLFSETEPGGIAKLWRACSKRRKIGLVNLTTALSILDVQLQQGFRTDARVHPALQDTGRSRQSLTEIPGKPPDYVSSMPKLQPTGTRETD